MRWPTVQEQATFARREHNQLLASTLPGLDRWNPPRWYLDWHTIRLLCVQNKAYTMSEVWLNPVNFRRWFEKQHVTPESRLSCRLRNPESTNFGPRTCVYVSPAEWEFLQNSLPKLLTQINPGINSVAQLARRSRSSRTSWYLLQIKRKLLVHRARALRNNLTRHRYPWLPSEEQYLRENVDNLLIETMAAYLGRSYHSVNGKIKKMGLRPARFDYGWTTTEECWLRENRHLSSQELEAGLPRHNLGSIRKRMSDLGLTESFLRPEEETRAVLQYVTGDKSMKELRAEFPHRSHILLLKHASYLRNKMLDINGVK